ncbi:hypothetical protein CY35_11G084600 [Sphagnum magellanicum]|nr:hypothetical protein CY35_11G084600 [Sphagnum magellanicum]
MVQKKQGDGSVDKYGHLADKHKTGGWRAAPLIFGTEICERMATLGLQRNLVTYFTKKIHMTNPQAANMVSNFVGTLYLTPFVGGFVADAYLGHFWTIAVFASIQVVGMVCLTLSAAIPSLRPPPCPSNNKTGCQAASGYQIGVLHVGLYLIAFGNGGIKPNVSTLGADQFDDSDPNERKHMSNFFNWFYFIISIGSLLSVTVFIYIQDNVGFGWGFGIPAAVMILAVVIFLAGSKIYRFKAAQGSPLATIAQVVIAAAWKWHLGPVSETVLYAGPVHGNEPLEKLCHTEQFRCLDRAAVPVGKLEDGRGPVSPWTLCSVSQVEEVKMIIRVLPIWVSTIIVWTALSQMETFSVEVGSTMDRRVGCYFSFPPASLSVFELVNVLLILPLYDKLLVPYLRRFTGIPQGITMLQRIGTGLVFSILAMLVAALVERRRVQVAREYGLLDNPDTTIPMSIFWLIPQYFLRGSTEIFTQVGQLEFFYNEAPDRMRSLGTAIYLSTIACGHFLSTVLVVTVNKVTQKGNHQGWLTDNLNHSRLDYFYFLLAGLSAANFVFFLSCARWYRYKKVKRISDDMIQFGKQIEFNEHQQAKGDAFM